MSDQKPRWWIPLKVVSACIVAQCVFQLLQPVFNNLFPDGITWLDVEHFVLGTLVPIVIQVAIAIVYLAALLFLIYPWSEWNATADSAPGAADALQSEEHS